MASHGKKRRSWGTPGGIMKFCFDWLKDQPGIIWTGFIIRLKLRTRSLLTKVLYCEYSRTVRGNSLWKWTHMNIVIRIKDRISLSLKVLNTECVQWSASQIFLMRVSKEMSTNWVQIWIKSWIKRQFFWKSQTFLKLTQLQIFGLDIHDYFKLLTVYQPAYTTQSPPCDRATDIFTFHLLLISVLASVSHR